MKKKIGCILLGCVLAIGVTASAATSSWSLYLTSTQNIPPSGSTSSYTVTSSKYISGSTTSQTVTAGGGNPNVFYILYAEHGFGTDRPVATWTNKSSGSGSASAGEKTYIKATGYTGGSKIEAKGSINY